jgi:lipoprotein
MQKQLISWILVIFECAIPMVLLTSCSNDDNPDEICQSDIIGIWNGKGGNYINDDIEFFDDGTAIRKYGSGTKLNKDKYKWIFGNSSLTLTDDLDNVSEHAVNSDGSQISFELDGTTYYKTILSKPGNSSSTTSDKYFVGEWMYKSSSTRTVLRYYFPNGKGYEKYIYDDKDYGLQYIGFVWETTEEGKITVHFDHESKPSEYDYVKEGKECILKRGNSERKWTKRSDNVDESFDPSIVPFANNYLLNRNTGYYYEITKMTSGCHHAGAGDNMNDKYLQFFGSNGNLTTTGLRIVYFTPRWEGIDSYWATGKYTMSLTSAAYKYSAMAWCNGSSLSTYDGILRISRSGSFTTYDYTDEEVELHVLVQND